MNASELVATSLDRYAQSSEYSDNATLVVQYRRDGQPFLESYSWSVSYSKPRLLKANLFSGRLIADGKKLVSYVYDFGTQNLDHQHLVMAASETVPFAQLVEDPIWRHYCCGGSELPPLSEAKSNRHWISPIFDLLTDLENASWLTSEQTNWKIVDREPIDGHSCIQLTAILGRDEYHVWIDESENLIRKIEYPHQFKLPEGAPENSISDFSMVVNFVDAKWNLPPANNFALKWEPHFKPVTQFIPVPERFPTPMIGEFRPSFEFSDSDGDQWIPEKSAATSALIFWTENSGDTESIQAIDELSKNNAQTDIVIAYTESQHPVQNNNESNHRVFFALDPRAETAKRFGIEAVPSLIVIGPFGKLQYAQSPLEPDWATKVDGALKRIANGDDVASEMKNSYRKFTETYNQKIKAEREKLGDLLHQVQ